MKPSRSNMERTGPKRANFTEVASLLDEYLRQVDDWESDRGYMEEHFSRWLRTLELISYVPPESRILDVGALDGSMIFLIKRLFHAEVAAADVRRTENDRWLKRFKHQGIDFRFWDVVEELPPFPERS